MPKDVTGKPELGLIPYKALAKVAEVRAFGIKKYKGDNWHDVPKKDFVNATVRHCMKYLSGETSDEESNLEHLAHAACSILLALGVESPIEKGLRELKEGKFKSFNSVEELFKDLNTKETIKPNETDAWLTDLNMRNKEGVEIAFKENMKAIERTNVKSDSTGKTWEHPLTGTVYYLDKVDEE